jgi:hypothetical protein
LISFRTSSINVANWKLLHQRDLCATSDCCLFLNRLRPLRSKMLLTVIRVGLLALIWPSNICIQAIKFDQFENTIIFSDKTLESKDIIRSFHEEKLESSSHLVSYDQQFVTQLAGAKFQMAILLFGKLQDYKTYLGKVRDSSFLLDKAVIVTHLPPMDVLEEVQMLQLPFKIRIGTFASKPANILLGNGILEIDYAELGLKRQELRVSYFHHPPFTILESDPDGSVQTSGVEFNLVNEIALSLNMEPKYDLPKDGLYWGEV